MRGYRFPNKRYQRNKASQVELYGRLAPLILKELRDLGYPIGSMDPVHQHKVAMAFVEFVDTVTQTKGD